MLLKTPLKALTAATVACFAGLSMISCTESTNSGNEDQAARDIDRATHIGDGTYRVTCKDRRTDRPIQNHVEFRTMQEILANQVCELRGGRSDAPSLRCVSRDGYNTVPYIIEVLYNGRFQTYTGARFTSRSQCERSLDQKRVFLNRLPVFCAPDQDDRRNPGHSLFYFNPRDGLEKIHFSKARSARACQQSLDAAVIGNDDSLLFCGSKDGEGNAPYSIFSYKNGTTTRSYEDHQSWQRCLDAVRNHAFARSNTPRRDRGRF